MIRVENLSCGYPHRVVLQNLHLHIRTGDFVGILGPNGSGKTTLILTLTGVLQPLTGSIHIAGRPLEELSSRERARLMAAIIQNEDIRFPFTCQEIVAMGRYPHQKRWQQQTGQDLDQVREAMSLTYTVSLAQRPITAVSGGEKQRVLFAKALAQATPVLLLDEATSAMDIHHRMRIYRLLERLNEEKKLTLITVLHDVNLAALFCKRLVFLNHGTIEADGATHEVLHEDLLRKVYGTDVIVYDVPGCHIRQAFFLP